MAVSLTAPAVFNFTAPSSPDRHREALLVFLGKERAHEATNLKDEDLGPKLSEEIQRFLDILEVPRGLSKVGYTGSDITSVSFFCLTIGGSVLTNLDVACRGLSSSTKSARSSTCLGQEQQC